MTYTSLGARAAQGAADTSGANKGNWTATFSSGQLGINVPSFECYHIVVTGAATNSTFNIYVNTNQWDVSVYAHQSSWDPAQPMLLNPGDTLSFYFSTPSTDGFMPTVTAWFRYDQSYGG